MRARRGVHPGRWMQAEQRQAMAAPSTDQAIGPIPTSRFPAAVQATRSPQGHTFLGHDRGSPWRGRRSIDENSTSPVADRVSCNTPSLCGQ